MAISYSLKSALMISVLLIGGLVQATAAGVQPAKVPQPAKLHKVHTVVVPARKPVVHRVVHVAELFPFRLPIILGVAF
jgi:hypothetical protein